VYVVNQNSNTVTAIDSSASADPPHALATVPVGSRPFHVAVGTVPGLACPDNQYRAEYYNNRSFTGSWAFTRCESGPIDYTWGPGGPGMAGVGGTNFAVRWTGRFGFDVGFDETWRFSAITDDGMRAWIDGAQGLNSWQDQPATTYTFDKPLARGMHTVQVEYYQNQGGARADFRWNRVADLVVTNTESADPVLAGSDLTYTLAVTNNGPSIATGVTLTDTLPANVTFRSHTAPSGVTCSTPAPGSSGTVSCPLGTLNSGVSRTLSVVVRPNAAAGDAGSITNTATATITGANPASDPNVGNNTNVSQTTTVTKAADLEVTSLTASANPVMVGANLTYAVTVRNNGPSTAHNVTVTDALPAGVTFVSASSGCTGTTTVTCNLGALASGGSGNATITVRPTTAASGGTAINNTVAVAATETDPATGNNQASRSVTADGTPPQVTRLGINGTTLPSSSTIVSAISTTSTDVTLTHLLATDDVTPTDQLRLSFSNDGITFGTLQGGSFVPNTWQTYTASTAWNLCPPPACTSIQDGTKTVYVKAQDAAGNVSASVSDTIVLDSTVRDFYSISINNGAQFTQSTNVALFIGANPGTAAMMLSNEGGFTGAVWEPFAAHRRWQIADVPGSVQSVIVYARFRDVNGIETTPVPDDIAVTLDTTVPSGAGGVLQRPPGSNVTVHLTATEDASQVTHYRVSNNSSFTGASFQPLPVAPGTPFPVTLDLGSSDTVYAQFRNNALAYTVNATVGSATLASPGLVADTQIKVPSVGVANTTLRVSAGAPATVSTSFYLPPGTVAQAPWLAIYGEGSADGVWIGAQRDAQPDPTGQGTATLPVDHTVLAGSSSRRLEVRLFSDKSGAYRRLATSPIFTVADTCSSGSQVGVTVAPDGTGRLRVAISARAGTLSQVRGVTDSHVREPNALVDMPNSAPGAPANFTARPDSSEYQFYVRPATPGQAVTLPLQIEDGCGGVWQTLVGAGANVLTGGAGTPTEVAVTRVAATAPPTSARLSPTPSVTAVPSTPSPAPTRSPTATPTPTAR
jgi:uncharacterized repeat protein (TIGR01451 family)